MDLGAKDGRGKLYLSSSSEKIDKPGRNQRRRRADLIQESLPVDAIKQHSHLGTGRHTAAKKMRDRKKDARSKEGEGEVKEREKDGIYRPLVERLRLTAPTEIAEREPAFSR